MRLLLLLAVVLLVAILVNFSSFVNGDTDPSDASVLRVLYTTLNSPGQLTKWSANGGDPCGESWTGITCSGNKVTEIQMSGLGLSGSLGSQLDSLKSVTNFDISNNNMGSQLPNQLPPNVQRLNVSHNQIQGSVVVSFDSLSALNTLDFSFNSMTGNLPQSFQSLTSMNKMYLQNNQFSGTIDVLANLPLRNLNVENNQFTGRIPDQLKGIVQSNGNSWISGPAPSPPPGTPPANNPNGDHKSRENSSNSGSRKSGIGGGGVAGIVISFLVVEQ